MNDLDDNDALYLVWMWQHYALSVFTRETLEDAVSLSSTIEDHGNGSLECIEGPEGIISKEVIKVIVDRFRDAESARASDAPNYTHYIELKSPDGQDSAQWDWYTSSAAAEAAYTELHGRFGDRVSLNEARRP